MDLSKARSCVFPLRLSVLKNVTACFVVYVALQIHPAVVHNNYVIGRENKKYRFEHFGLWFIADKDEDYACHLHD